MLYPLIFFGIGFLIAFLCTPWAIRLSHRGIGLDVANEPRKRHAAPVPRIGGFPIMLAVTVGLLAIFLYQPEQWSKWFPILLGSLCMFGIGFWDDLKPLGARKKLAGQIFTALLVCWQGLRIEQFSYPGADNIQLGVWAIPVTVFWLIAVPNIVNLIDGFDGLAGGLGLCMSVTLGIVGLYNGQQAVACYAFTMAGATLGFLTFNFPPARIYLGDGGAYLIGFTIAALSLVSSNKGSVAAVLFVTLVALGVPILDTTFALLRRGLRGYPLFHADDEHFHHKLENLGFSKRRILLGLYGVCLVLSLCGLSIIWSQGRTLPIAIGIFFLLALLVLRYFHLMRTWSDVQRHVDRVFRRRHLVQYALLHKQLLELELQRCQSGQEFWPVFRHALRRVGFVDEGEVKESITVHLKYDGVQPWTLHAPKESGTTTEWYRLAECFRPVYAQAIHKWP